MAKYNIKSLNYIACGDARNFINMDLELGYEVYDYVHLLCAEAGSSGFPDIESWRQHALSSDISVDIGLEHGEGSYYPSDYIFRDQDLALSKERLADGVILNEQQSFFNESDSSSRKYIRLYLSCCTLEILEKIKQFNRERTAPNQTFLLENSENDVNNLTADNGSTIRNAYDIRDISIRRLGRSESQNAHLEGKKMMYPDRLAYQLTHQDIYVPQMQRHPVGFCQSNTQTGFGSDVIMMTYGSDSTPGCFETDIETRREDTEKSRSFDIEIKSSSNKSYVYDPQKKTAGLGAFQPVKSYNGIDRSFLIDMPINDNFAQNSIFSQYKTGEIYYKRLMTCKNLYDNRYSMLMPDANILSAARTYCGICTCAGQTYLKYWDDSNYTTVSADSDKLVKLQTEKTNSYDNTKFSDVKPYQKIEYLYPTDYAQAATHKTNMFSLEIGDTGIGALEDECVSVLESDDASSNDRAQAESRLKKLEILKRDITSAIKDIARNITPANTQLFDVYFKDN